jgi:transcriptional regulator with XRE-family HTH domain
MKLRTYREENGLTLAQMAEKVGVSEVSMSRYERGDRMPRPEVMRKIGEVTGGAVRPNDFFGAEEDAAEEPVEAPRARPADEAAA